MSVQFEVGDVVTGKQIATERYSVTIRGAIMEVVEVWDDMIRVRVVGVDESMASISIKMAYPHRGQHDQIAMVWGDAKVGTKFSVCSRYFEAYIPDEDYTSKLNDFLDEM